MFFVSTQFHRSEQSVMPLASSLRALARAITVTCIDVTKKRRKEGRERDLREQGGYTSIRGIRRLTSVLLSKKYPFVENPAIFRSQLLSSRREN